jgi:Concanavalin A-like lectin/glucanases superfamily
MFGEIAPRIRYNSAQLGNVKSQVYASATLGTGQALVQQGSTTYGPDMTAALQALLTAAAGSTLVIDGQYGILGSLGIPGKTTVVFPKGCGLIHAAGATGPLMYNAGMLSAGSMAATARGVGGAVGATNGTSTPSTLGSFVSTNIKIIGGIFNGNSQAQSGNAYNNTFSFYSGLQFFGVDGLRLEDVTVYDANGYHVWLCNVRNAGILNLHVDATNNMNFGDDGLHLNGPCQYIQARNLWLKTADDGIALNADDGGEAAQHSTPFPWPGAITDVLVDGVFLDNAHGHLMRILSNTQLVDRVTIKDVTGTVAVNTGGVTIDCYAVWGNNPPAYQTGTFGPGNYGSITCRDWALNVGTGGENYQDEGKGVIYLNGNSGNFTFENIRLIPTGVISHPLFYVDNTYPGAFSARQITIDDCEYQELNTTANAQPLVTVVGRVENLALRHCRVERGAGLAIADAPLVKVAASNSSLVCDNLSVSDCYTSNVNSMIEVTGGRIGYLKASGYHHNSGTSNAVTIASGATVDNFDTTALASDVSTKVSNSGTITNDVDTGGTFAIRTGIPNLWNGLMAYWRMAETSGTTVFDSLGNFNLTAIGTIAAGTAFGSLATQSFNGSQYYLSGDTGGTAARLIQCGQLPQPSTIMGWINIASFSALQGLALRGNNSAPRDWLGLYVNNTGTKITADSGSSSQFAVSTAALSTGTWYHVAVVQDPFGQLGTINTPLFYLYLNGVSQGSATWATPSGPNNTDALAIGASSAGTVILANGTLLTAWGVWAVPLTAAQVSLAYNGGTPVYIL